MLKTVPLDENGYYLLQATFPHLLGVIYDFELNLTDHCHQDHSVGYGSPNANLNLEFLERRPCQGKGGTDSAGILHQ